MIRQIEKSLTMEFWIRTSSNKRIRAFFRRTKLLVGTIVKQLELINYNVVNEAFNQKVTEELVKGFKTTEKIHL